ncbi:MAG: rod shape-determining protein MreD [Chloroflexaceae bacterium]
MGNSQPKRIEEFLAREILLIFGLVALALVQVTLLPSPLGFPPALLLILAICRLLVGIGEGESHPESSVAAAIRWAFYGGIGLDLCSASPLGSHALALLLAVILVALVTRHLRVEGEGLLLPILAVLLGMLVYEGMLALLLYGPTLAQSLAPVDWQRYAVVVVLPSILQALIPTLPLFMLLRWLFRTR